jgi:hypothetical protein
MKNIRAKSRNPQDEIDRARALGGQDVAASPGVAKAMQSASRKKRGPKPVRASLPR